MWLACMCVYVGGKDFKNPTLFTNVNEVFLLCFVFLFVILK